MKGMKVGSVIRASEQNWLFGKRKKRELATSNRKKAQGSPRRSADH